MKQKIWILLLLLSIVSGSRLYAESTVSDLYVKTIYIRKVYNNKLGFRVDYQTANMNMQAVYMPIKWFGASGGYGEVVYGNHPTAPYMSIWYKDGKIDHFRLYVKDDFADPSWGTFRRLNSSEEDFNVEVLTLVY